jgi:hypothetical protein
MSQRLALEECAGHGDHRVARAIDALPHCGCDYPLPIAIQPSIFGAQAGRRARHLVNGA